MRILLLVLTILCVLVASGMGLMIGNENLAGDGADRLAELDQMVAAAGDNLPAELQDMVDKANGYKTAGWAGIIIGLLGLVMAVVSFMKDEKKAMIVAGVTVVASLLFIVLAPGFETGEYGPASPQKQVMVFAIPAILASVFGFLAVKKKAAAG